MFSLDNSDFTFALSPSVQSFKTTIDVSQLARKMAGNDKVTENSEGLSSLQKLCKEVKEWRSHWRWSRFLNALVLGFAVSLFDSVTDFNFARSVPEDCRNTTNSSVKPFDKVYVSSPCGLLYYKNVERLT